MECRGNRSGVLGPTLLKCSQYTLVGVDTGIRSSCMHRNLMIRRRRRRPRRKLHGTGHEKKARASYSKSVPF